MKTEKIKPIPKYIIDVIRKEDNRRYPKPSGFTRYYAYLAKNDGELAKITVAVRHKYNRWYCKQVAVHGIHSDICFIKDITFYCIGGYVTGWFEEGLQQYPKWYETTNWNIHSDKYFDPYAPVINIKYLEKFSKYKYSAIELYKGVKVLQYLRLYEQHPQMEYLMKLGLQCIADSKTILKRIGKDKKFCKWLIRNKQILQNRYFYKDVILRAYTSGRDLTKLQILKEQKLKLAHNGDYAPIKELFNGKELERFFLYAEKHDVSYAAYLDYLKACNYLNLDMSEDKNRFPHDFKRWHDIRIDQYATAKAEKDKEKRMELYRQFACVAKKYISLQHLNGKAYICVIAKSPAELIREGEVLDHCVGRMNYDQRVAREESLIFFVRNFNRPDTPFVTVEYSLSLRKILQCYGEHNYKPDDKVLHYVHHVWLPYANKHLKQLAA